MPSLGAQGAPSELFLKKLQEEVPWGPRGPSGLLFIFFTGFHKKDWKNPCSGICLTFCGFVSHPIETLVLNFKKMAPRLVFTFLYSFLKILLDKGSRPFFNNIFTKSNKRRAAPPSSTILRNLVNNGVAAPILTIFLKLLVHRGVAPLLLLIWQIILIRGPTPPLLY